MSAFDYDVIVIGSGFGGSVAALRATEKGYYDVCHGSRFDLSTGAVINGPATAALALYEVREVDGVIQARI